jgi:hypothetical protein
MSANATLISTVRNFVNQIVNGDGTNKEAVVTPVPAGTRVKSLRAVSDDTASKVIQLWLTVSAVDYLLGEIPVGAGAGSDGGTTPAVNLLNATYIPGLQFDGVSYFMDIADGSVLKASVKVAMTATKTMHIVGDGGDFT